MKLKVPVGRHWEDVPVTCPPAVRELLDQITESLKHPDPHSRRLRGLLAQFESAVFKPHVAEKLSKASITTRHRVLTYTTAVWGTR